MSDVIARSVLEVGGDASGFEAAMARAEAAAKRGEAALVQSASKGSAAWAGVGQAATPGLAQLEGANKRAAESMLITAARMQGSAGAAALYKAQLKGLNTEALEPYAAVLNKAALSQTAVSKSAEDFAKRLGLVNISAGQATAAMRQLPSQMTDVFVSLASGQPALTVLLQQGGQIKDTFGGFGNAFKALASVLTPARVVFGGVAAAVTALGFAYKAGAQETDDYRKAIVLTGNAAGVTIGQLQRMAMAVAASTGATQGKAAEVLTQLAGSAQVAGGQLKFLTEAAIRLERAGGPAALETAKAFAALADAPTEAAIKLSKSTGFLTAAVYEQARALELQGKKSEAAAVVQKAAAEATNDQARRLESGLGTLEKAWRGVTDVAKGAWDAMLGIGRAETVESRLSDATAAVTRARKLSNLPAFSSSPLAEPAAAVEAQGIAQSDARTARMAADMQRTRQETEKAGVEFKRMAESVRTADKVLEDQLATVRNVGSAAGLQTTQIEELVKRMRSLSQANAQAIALAQAGIQGDAAIAAAKVAQAMQDLQHLSAMTIINDAQVIQAQGQLLLAASRDQEEIIRRQIEVAKALPADQAATAIRKLTADLEVQQRRSVQVETDTTEKLEQLRNRRRIAADLAHQAELELDGQAALALVLQRQSALEGIGRQIADYAASLEDAAYAAGQEQAAAMQGDLQRSKTLGLLRIELDLRKRLRDIEGNSALTGADKEIEKGRITALAQQEADQLVNKVVRDFEVNGARQISDSLLTALEDGFDNAWDYLKKLAKREVIRVTFQPITNAIGQIISGALTQMQGGTPTGANYLQAASALSSVYGAAQRGYGAVSGWFGGSSAGSSTALSGWDAAMVDAGAGATTTGASAGASGAASSTFMTPAFWAAIIAMGYNQAQRDYAEGFRSAQTRDAIDRYGPGITAFGGTETYVAQIMRATGFSDRLAETLSGSTIAARTFGRAAPRVEAAGVSGTISGGDFTGNQFVDILEKGGWLRSDRRHTELTAATDELNRFMDQGARDILDNVTRFGAALGLPAEQIASVTSDMRVVLTDDVEANRQALIEAFNGYGDDLVAAWADAVRPLATYGETTTQTIQRVGAAVSDVNAVLQSLGMSALQASVDGGRAAIALQSLFGGSDNLRMAAGSYLQNFFSDSERSDLTRSAIGRSLGNAGISAVPTSRAEFRALVEAQSPMTEQGRTAIAALLGVAEAFASITQEARSAEDILNERQGLERQILEAQGDTAALRALERQALDESNRALYDRLNALKDERAVTSERQGLERQLLEVQGDTAALRGLERAALDESNRALYDRLIALKDERAAQQAAIEAARSAQQAFDNLQQSINDNIGQFQSPRERIDYGVAGVQASLAAVGVNATTAQLLGASRQQIADFAVQFVRLAGVSDEAKRAVVEAAAALAGLGQTASELAASAVQGQIDTLLQTYGDVESALRPAAETLADAFRRTGQEADSLQQSLDRMLGRATVTVQDALATLLQQQSALAGFRSTLAEQIDSARLQGMSPAARVAALRARETVLSAQLGSAADPVAVAQRLQSTILDRIRIESSLSTQVYDDQIAALTTLRDLSAEISQFTAELRIGELSPLSPVGQLEAARALFDSTLAGARSGSADAMGNLLGNSRTYLSEARGFFASGSQYADIFGSVTGALDQLGIAGANADPQIQALEDLRESSDSGSAATVDALARLDAALASRATADQARIDRQIELAEAQIADVRETNRLLQAQLAQRAEELAVLRAQLDSLTTAADSIASSLEREAAAP